VSDALAITRGHKPIESDIDMSNLKDRAVLMRFSAGLPGEQRQDKNVTAEVKQQKQLGERAGKWDKYLYPPEALEAIKAKQGEAREYHNEVTLPFDTGIGILPAALIKEYGDRMRQFKGEVDNLVESTFLADPQKWIDWAVKEHNGTFEPGNYPGCQWADQASHTVKFDQDEFRNTMRKKFYFRSEPLPVPDSEHFTAGVSSLLGTDLESVNLRVRDAAAEAQRELLSRILAPVKKMAEVLGRENPRIYETLTGNIKAICRIAPALNLADDPAIASAIQDCETLLAKFDTEGLREQPSIRRQAKDEVDNLVARLSGYKL